MLLRQKGCAILFAQLKLKLVKPVGSAHFTVPEQTSVFRSGKWILPGYGRYSRFNLTT
jgi:hypothetical protein